ncbi:MAG: hypothetical protein BJ554DRAFT_7925 [Olpidium bornovanus]|uniref:KRR1 small subunit processome component second KH domain-containing protein n=1 Tax=Olpidium bornovanus TaxID=278681 RepID=A0A8H8DJ26_9FUNG|nr:MAG: hypothetical protein BJ554DRAFT_7925 [Olpidium bornovanus]
MMVQGNTVSAMGPYKGLKELRRIVIDCMKNIHPVYHIKELMIKRELANDPKLANESWDRFLPKFRKQSSKPLKRSKKADGEGAKPKKSEKKKKTYTPFPPAQTPRKVDLQLESGEYFLRPAEKAAREMARKEREQAEKTERKRVERAKVFKAPKEETEKKKKRKRTESIEEA